MDEVGIADKKNTVVLLYNDTQLTFSGDFDSGNLNWAGVNEETNQIQLQFGKDKEVKPSAKFWFHFSVSGQYTSLPVKLHLMRTNSLNLVAKAFDMYRPVVKTEGSEWQRHIEPVQFEISPENQVSFRMNIELKDSKTIFIANCYPWSLSDNDSFLNRLEKSLKSRKDVYYNKQTLIYSIQKRPLDLLALSSGEVNENEPEEYLQHLFPNRSSETHFKRIAKPLVLITCRVHPGEVGSSHTLNGILEFLSSNKEEANQLLKQFYFLFVPILNPDGVFNGNNRMDALGQNLNRFYLFPDHQKQPSCFAIKELLQLVRHQLYAYFDLHGHANRKSFYLYGNSIQDQKIQAQSVLFASYLAKTCEFVDLKSCNFSKKQMTSKDKNDDFSKEGCARVVVYKWTNSPYCYTLETSLYKNVTINERGEEVYDEEFYGPRTYAEVGTKMLLSLHAIFKNGEELEEMRAEALEYVIRMEKEALQKEKQKKKVVKKKGSKNKQKEKKQDLVTKDEETNQPCSDKIQTCGQNESGENKGCPRKKSEKIEKQSIDYLLSLHDEA